MALRAASLFLYGFEIHSLNYALDFRSVSGGPVLAANLRRGFYTLSSLATEIERALHAAETDSSIVYSVSIDRAISAGTQNRVTIESSGTHFELLFNTGRIANVASLIGFTITDHTGSTSYTGTSSAGTILAPDRRGYNYLAPEIFRKNFGTVNISASGLKESVTFNLQKFWQVQFKYIRRADLTAWSNLMSWMVLQKPIEFTPEVSAPNTFYEGHLESTASDGQGLGFTLAEMLPAMPDFHDTGLMKFRVKES